MDTPTLINGETYLMEEKIEIATRRIGSNLEELDLS